jgi:hypothetical protein
LWEQCASSGSTEGFEGGASVHGKVKPTFVSAIKGFEHVYPCHIMIFLAFFKLSLRVF